MLNGRIGQVVGPFKSNVNLLEKGEAISNSTPESTTPVLWKLGIQAEPGCMVKINNTTIRIGKTGIYELDSIARITHLSFPSETDADTIIDFIY